MNKTPMDNINEIVDSKFRFVLLAAERAEQMMRGARTKDEALSGKHVRVAMKEVLLSRVDWDYGPAPEAAPESEPVEAPAEEKAADGETAGESTAPTEGDGIN